MIEESIQLGDPVEHRGIVIAPLYPRNNPKADYLTLEEALPLGFQITEVDEAGSVPELVARQPTRQRRPALRRRRVARCQAEPDPQRDRSRRGQERDADSSLVRRARALACAQRQLRRRAARRLSRPSPPQGRAAERRAARARRRPGRRLGRGCCQGRPPRRPLPHRRLRRHLPRPRDRARRAPAGVPARARPVRRPARPRRAAALPRLPLPARRRSRASTRSSSTATCSTRSSTSTESPPAASTSSLSSPTRTPLQRAASAQRGSATTSASPAAGSSAPGSYSMRSCCSSPPSEATARRHAPASLVPAGERPPDETRTSDWLPHPRHRYPLTHSHGHLRLLHRARPTQSRRGLDRARKRTRDAMPTATTRY